MACRVVRSGPAVRFVPGRLPKRRNPASTTEQAVVQCAMRPVEIIERNCMSNYAEGLLEIWETDPRWSGIVRPYRAEDVERLRGTVPIEYTLARMGSERLWHLFHTEPYVAALGALTGNQAVQQ